MFQGGFQVYLRVSHFNRNPATSNPDFDPPFIDPLIDNVYFEFSTPAALFDDRLTPPFQRVESTGEFGRVRAEVQIGVHCADNWIGSACEMLCDGDSCITGNGYLTLELFLYTLVVFLMVKL